MSTNKVKNRGEFVPPKYEPTALAYLRKNGELYICAESWLKGLGGTPDEPFLSQTIEDNVEVLGNALLLAKDGGAGYIERENHREYIAPYVEMAGLNTYAQFAKNTKSVIIIFNPTVIEFGPQANRRGNWYGMPDAKLEIPTNSCAKSIGETLIDAFSRATV